jgi:hypothetical protein
MVERGHEVFAAAPDIDSDVAAKLCALGATPVPVVLGRTSLDPIATWRSGRALRAQVREIAPDVMIAYTIKPVVLGAVAARAARVPCFAAMITGPGLCLPRRASPEAARHPARRHGPVSPGAGRLPARHLPERG